MIDGEDCDDDDEGYHRDHHNDNVIILAFDCLIRIMTIIMIIIMSCAASIILEPKEKLFQLARLLVCFVFGRLLTSPVIKGVTTMAIHLCLKCSSYLKFGVCEFGPPK